MSESDDREIELMVGQNVRWNHFALTLNKVVHDGRCPEGMNCFWAGIVIVELMIVHEGKGSTLLIGNTNGQTAIVNAPFDPQQIQYDKKPARMDRFSIALAKVLPARMSLDEKIPARKYRFSFHLKRR